MFYLLIAFTALSSALAHSDGTGDFDPNEYRSFKVIGRGVLDRETQQTLQLACVGPLHPSTGERDCSTLNFLLTEASGVQKLVGQPFHLQDGEKVKAQLARQMEERHLKDGLFQSAIMRNTRYFFTSRKDPFYTRTIGLVAGGFTLLAAWPVALSAGIVIGVPLFVDLVFLSGAISDFKLYGKKTLNATSAAALSDRSKFQWQVSPRKVRTKPFQALLSLLQQEELNDDLLQALQQPAEDAPNAATLSECYVDAVEVRYSRASIGEAIRNLGKKAHGSDATDEVLEKAAVIALLKKSGGYTVDSNAILDGSGSRGSKVVLEIREGHDGSDQRPYQLFHASLSRGGVESSGRNAVQIYGKSARKTAEGIAATTVRRYFAESRLPCEPRTWRTIRAIQL